MKVCRLCGLKYRDEFNFCLICGNPLSDERSPELTGEEFSLGRGRRTSA